MFVKRLCSSVVLLAIALTTILAGGNVLLLTLLIVSLIGLREFYLAMEVHKPSWKFNLLEYMGYFAAAVYYLLLFIKVDIIYLFPLSVLQLIAFMAVYVLMFPKYKAQESMFAFYGLIYVPLMLSFIYLTRELTHGIYMVWLAFISSWICDTCAYCVGMLFGRNKLAPKLSPKKSVEGAVGGVAGAALVGGLYGVFASRYMDTVQQIPLIFAVISGAGAIISQIGDLAASGIKRDHNIKDYGKLIPGHGGILDRFDSVIFTAPIIYFLAIVMLHGVAF